MLQLQGIKRKKEVEDKVKDKYKYYTTFAIEINGNDHICVERW